jgi:hypothetical protein
MREGLSYETTKVKSRSISSNIIRFIHSSCYLNLIFLHIVLKTCGLHCEGVSHRLRCSFFEPVLERKLPKIQGYFSPKRPSRFAPNFTGAFYTKSIFEIFELGVQPPGGGVISQKFLDPRFSRHSGEWRPSTFTRS